MKNQLDGVSVVVCVNRDAEKLERLLKRLSDQSYPVYEVIVVNDGPSPEINALFIHRFDTGVNPLNLRILDFDSNTKTTPGKKAPLTQGIRAAQYEWILLTDGDCVPGPEWISEMMANTTQDIRMVLGVAPFFKRPGFLNLLQRLDGFITTVQYVGAALYGKPYMGVGRNLLYHRSLFNQANGFISHAHIASGDDDLFVQSVGNALNTTVSSNEKSFVFSESPSTWPAWLHQKRRHLSASNAYTVSARFRTTIFALSWIVMWLILPVVISNGIFWLVSGMTGVIFMWVLFARATKQLRQSGLTLWFPLLAVSYCVMLCTFAVLLSLRAPKTWMRS